MAVTSRRRVYTWSRHVMSHMDYYVGYLCRMFPLLLLVQLSHISHTRGRDDWQPPSEPLRITTVLMEPYTMTDATSINATDIHLYGYIPDLIFHLSRVIGFEYSIHLAPDQSYGRKLADGTWNGMIGELMSKRADIAAAPMYVTEYRGKVVDFTSPYIQVHATVLLKKPPSGEPLTIRSASDLVRQEYIKVGTMKKGVIRKALRTSNDSVPQMLWRHMQTYQKDTFTETNEQGIVRVRNEDYAFILPSTIGEYVSIREPCDVITVDRFLMNQSYALAVQKGSPLLPELNGGLRVLEKSGHLSQFYHKWWSSRSQCNGVKTGHLHAGGATREHPRPHVCLIVMLGWTIINTVYK